MPSVPKYLSGPLASSNVGVPRVDPSGQMTAEAFSHLAGTAMKLLGEEAAAQKEASAKLDISAARTQYQAQYLRDKEEILNSGIASDQVEQALNERSQKISETLIAGLDDGATRQAVQEAIQLDQDAFKVDAVKERIGLAHKEAYNKWFSTVDTTIDDMKAAGTADAYTAAVSGFLGMQPALVPLTGNSLESAQKVTQNAIDAATTQFVAAGIEQGKEDLLQQMFVLGKFNQASEGVQGRVDKTIAEALKTRRYRADITTAYNVLNDNVSLVEGLRAQTKTFSDVEHELSSTTFELATGQYSESQKTDLQSKVDVLDAIRKAMLTGAYTRAADDLDTVTALRVEAASLIKRQDGEQVLADDVFLSDLKKFQDRLVREFVDNQNISGKTFNSLYADTYGVMVRSLTEKTFKQSGWENLINATPAATTPIFTKGERRPMFQIYDAAKREDGSVDPDVMFRAYDEYLNDANSGKLPGGQITPELAKDYYTRASLRAQGLSGVYKVGDMIPTRRGPRKVVGFDHGRVMVEETEQDRQTVKYFKQFGAMKN